MNGSLALVGSGEYLPAMAEFEKSLLDDGIKNGKENIYIQIPTAAAQESQSRLDFWRELGQKQANLIGSRAIFLPIYTRDDAFNLSLADQIKNAGLIYMSGGDPHYLANTLIDTPVWSAIMANWQSGGSLAGCSAGAMVLSSQIPNFRLSRATPTLGLNLIPDLRVIPHFNKFFKWIPESAAKLLMNVPGDLILIGIDELTAVVKRGGQSQWQVWGEAKLHILKGLPQRQLESGEEISF